MTKRVSFLVFIVILIVVGITNVFYIGNEEIINEYVKTLLNYTESENADELNDIDEAVDSDYINNNDINDNTNNTNNTTTDGSNSNGGSSSSNNGASTSTTNKNDSSNTTNNTSNTTTDSSNSNSGSSSSNNGASTSTTNKNDSSNTTNNTSNTTTDSSNSNSGSSSSNNGASTSSATTNNTKDTTATTNDEEKGTAIELFFLNTQVGSGITSNESIVFKTHDNKIVVIDTGSNNETSYKVLKEKLYSLSGSKNITVDYLVISHSHADHMGNLAKLLANNDSKNYNITIKNIIYKNEKLDESISGGHNAVHDLINTKGINKQSSAKIIDTTKINSDYKEYKISDKVTMTIFNLKDVFANQSKEDCEKTFDTLVFKRYSSGTGTTLKYNNKYVALESLSSDKVVLLDTNTEVGRYYAFKERKTNRCNSNANSIVVFLTIKTDKGNKYVYIPSDLENNGYPLLGEYNNVFKGNVYGNGSTRPFEDWTINNGILTLISTNVNPIKIASESRVAKRIKEYIGSKNLDNIVIYQESHHGINNAKDAINLLNLNRKNVIAIITARTNGEGAVNARLARGYESILSNIPSQNKISTGAYKKSNGKFDSCKSSDSIGCTNKIGVRCIVTTTGKYKCADQMKANGSKDETKTTVSLINSTLVY